MMASFSDSLVITISLPLPKEHYRSECDTDVLISGATDMIVIVDEGSEARVLPVEVVCPVPVIAAFSGELEVQVL